MAAARSITCTSLGEVALFKVSASRLPSGENASPPITPIGSAGRRISRWSGSDSTRSLLMPSSLLVKARCLPSSAMVKPPTSHGMFAVSTSNLPLAGSW